MSQVIPFKKPKASVKHKGNTLCKRGFHKWEIVKSTPFDVKSGQLITRQQCQRCGITRVK